MATLWRGVIREYADRLPMLEGAPVVTLQEGGTPLIPAEHLSELVGVAREFDVIEIRRTWYFDVAIRLY